MIRRRTAERGDVYWIDPNPTSGREMRGRHRFVEKLDADTAEEIVSRVLSIIDPEENTP